MSFLTDPPSSIKIYTVPHCVYCRMAKDFFDKKNFPYIEYDLSKNASLRENIFNLIGEIGVPVIEIKGEIFVGFDREGVERALSLS